MRLQATMPSMKFKSSLLPTTWKKRGFTMVQLTLVGVAAMALPDSNPAQSVTCSEVRHKFYQISMLKYLFFLTRA